MKSNMIIGGEELSELDVIMHVIEGSVSNRSIKYAKGSGWIDSPAGAYRADPKLVGKANFGFVAKYNKDVTIPMGKTEFLFKAGNLNFRSDSYQKLVIAGAHAKFEGKGTINGEGFYKFMITAEDGLLAVKGSSTDKFRIKIWKEDEITTKKISIYDNMLNTVNYASLDQSTQLRSGNISIHT